MYKIVIMHLLQTDISVCIFQRPSSKQNNLSIATVKWEV